LFQTSLSSIREAFLFVESLEGSFELPKQIQMLLMLPKGHPRQSPCASLRAGCAHHLRAVALRLPFGTILFQASPSFIREAFLFGELLEGSFVWDALQWEYRRARLELVMCIIAVLLFCLTFIQYCNNVIGDESRSGIKKYLQDTPWACFPW
jgi:hypothetical protein